jgi:hypothetical protein
MIDEDFQRVRAALEIIYFIGKHLGIETFDPSNRQKFNPIVDAILKLPLDQLKYLANELSLPPWEAEIQRGE